MPPFGPSLPAAFALCCVLVGCSTSGLHIARPTWRDQVAYHALLVASQYQDRLRVVIAKLTLSAGTPEELETTVATPLKESVAALTGVSEVNTQLHDGAVRLEVHYASAPGNEEKKQVRRIVEEFLKRKADNSKPPEVTLGAPIIR